METIKVAFFLAYKSILRGNHWALALTILVMALSFVNLIFTASLLNGVMTTLDDSLAAVLEPGAPPPSRRLAALAAVAEAGIPTWVFVSPVLPGLTDDPAGLGALVAEARRRGAGDVEYDPLNFYPGAVHALSGLMARIPSALPRWRTAMADPAAWKDRVAAIMELLVAS